MSPARARKVFRIVYAILAANFLVPTLLYIFRPEIAVESAAQIGTLLGGGEYPSPEQSLFWYVLGVGNVATLGFCCLLLLIDLDRYHPVLVPLVFLKSCSIVGFAIVYARTRYPFFLAAVLFDAVTCAAFIVFARAARSDRS